MACVCPLGDSNILQRLLLLTLITVSTLVQSSVYYELQEFTTSSCQTCNYEDGTFTLGKESSNNRTNLFWKPSLSIVHF